MLGLPPKADMPRATWNVREGPIGDINHGHQSRMVAQSVWIVTECGHLAARARRLTAVRRELR
jgi:hypothetical protein